MPKAFRPLQPPPGSNACLSTCVCAILLHRGISASLQEIQFLCNETDSGCELDYAVQSLDEKYTVEDLTGDESAVRACVSEDSIPVIGILQYELALNETAFHAVVIIEISAGIQDGKNTEIVKFMDPMTGRIEEDSTGLFWYRWSLAGERAFIVSP